jgi:hypothetical protein
VSDLGQFIDCVVKFNREAEYRASFEAMADDYLERAPRHMVPKELRR